MEVATQEQEAAIRRYEEGEISLRDLCREIGQSNDAMENIRTALAAGTLQTIFEPQAKTAVSEAFQASSALLDKVCAPMEVQSFAPVYDLRIDSENGLTYLPAGGRASQVVITAAGEPLRISRFAASIVIDEVDLLNGNAEALVSMPTRILAQRAGAVLMDELVHALLSNPTMADGTALFHSDRGNTASATLDEAGLTAARSYLKGQKDGAGNCYDADASILLTAAALDGTARTVLNKIQSFAASDNLELITTARLDSDTKHPITGDKANGSATAWFVLPNPKELAAFKLLFRRGTNRGLTSTVTNLGQGRRGLAVDVCLDAAVVCTNPQAIYRGHA